MKVKVLVFLKSLTYASAITLACAVTPILTVQAGIVRQVAASQVSGQTAKNSSLETVEVWNGHGVSISFYEMGETIKRIWLDDSSSIIFDVDGCLEGLEGAGKCSGNSGAGLIHLRRIDKILIPGLPQADHGAHMTVVTETGSSTKTKKIYHFRVVPGSGNPKYSEVEIIKDTEPSVQPKVNYTAISDSRSITQGMKVALKNNWITANGDLWLRLTQTARLRSQGEELEKAALAAGVSMELVEKLIFLGSNSQN